MADAKLKVTFTDIEIHKDGDPIDRGDICWSLKVDGAIVTSRSSANPYKIGSGGNIPLGVSSIVTKSGAVGTKLVVSGSVSEVDSGVDESASFSQSYVAAGNWGTGNVQSAPLSDKNMSVTVHYIIERV
jgi:hypothetical protein